MFIGGAPRVSFCVVFAHARQPDTDQRGFDPNLLSRPCTELLCLFWYYGQRWWNSRSDASAAYAQLAAGGASGTKKISDSQQLHASFLASGERRFEFAAADIFISCTFHSAACFYYSIDST
jgi:hypothetical protein